MKNKVYFINMNVYSLYKQKKKEKSFKAVSTTVWVCWKAMIEKKTIKEK